jgi:biopolymer transport protein ExbB
VLGALENTFPWFGYMIDLGGDILLIIIILAALLWTLIVERLVYLNRVYPNQVLLAVKKWNDRDERRSWHAQQFRRFIIHKANQSLQRNLGLLRTLIKLCPLLGLLGTVVGMLEIFDAVAITGGTNPRATAAGVSKAIITTMAGMVVAISALPVVGMLGKRVSDKKGQLADALPLDG